MVPSYDALIQLLLILNLPQPRDHAHHRTVLVLSTALPPAAPVAPAPRTTPPRRMTTPKVAKDFFKDAQAAFTPIVGAPNDDDVKRLTEAFINALQSIDVPGGAIDLSDLLLWDADHEAKHGVGSTFESMAIPLLAYDDSTASDATNAVRAKAERL